MSEMSRMKPTEMVELAIEASRTLALNEAKLAILDLQTEYIDDDEAFITLSRALRAIDRLFSTRRSY